MKTLLFVIDNMGIGGTTVSTRHLISILDEQKYDIRLWVLNPNGILQWMYDDIRQIPTCFSAKALALTSWREEKNWPRRIAAAIIRFGSNKSALFKKVVCRRAIRRCTSGYQFDTVIACQEGLLSSFVSYFDTPNKVAWIRCDYKLYFQSHKQQRELFYNSYNHIVCVAENTKDNFIELYPELANRTLCIYNPQDCNLIISHSNRNDNDARFKKVGYVILSVGRLDRVKRFAEIPRIARGLLDKGVNFVWYIVGDGCEWAHITKNITLYGLENNVIMLGAKSNPHYYLKQADLYVCLSSTEACPRVINEAKILGTPVVSTDFPTIYEYLKDGINGRIVSLNEMTDAIYEILTDNTLYSRIKTEIEDFSFDNTSLVKKLEEIL